MKQVLMTVALALACAAAFAQTAQGGFDPSLGGRPIRREIARMVEAPLAELLLRGEATPGDVVWVTVEDGKVVVDLVK